MYEEIKLAERREQGMLQKSTENSLMRAPSDPPSCAVIIPHAGTCRSQSTVFASKHGKFPAILCTLQTTECSARATENSTL